MSEPEELLALLRTRRSIRRFKPGPVPREALERIIEHAAYAPSAMNLQDWYFVIVEREETRRALLEASRKRWDEIAATHSDSGAVRELAEHALRYSRFDASPALIAVACRRIDDLKEQVLADNAEAVAGSMISAAMAAQNLMLAAHAMGFGTCCYTGPLAARKELEKRLGFRRRHKLVCLIAIGVPDEAPSAPARKPLKYIARFEE